MNAMVRASGGNRRQWLILAAAACLSACGTVGRRRSYTAQPGYWRGRIALLTEEERPQSHVASFELRGSAEQGELQVFNPLGSVLAQLRWSAQAAQLRSGSDSYYSDSLDDLVARVFGSPIPVRALFGWLAGEAVPAPGWQADLSRFGEGRITALREQPLPRATLRVILESAEAQEQG